MTLRKGFRRIRTISLEEARARHGRDDVVFVDLRDVREL
ncbi:MAG: rhodanese-like domain-containing protein, partial [Candidatus Rokubacteria bacterium]|nr:rhodanese-like domain-containing protein [Candidatus Rokubacteria bacterium]